MYGNQGESPLRRDVYETWIAAQSVSTKTGRIIAPVADPTIEYTRWLSYPVFHPRTIVFWPTMAVRVRIDDPEPEPEPAAVKPRRSHCPLRRVSPSCVG